MAASIQTFVDAVMGHALLAAGVFPGITYAVGRRAVKENATPPRVVWVPTNGVIAPALEVGGARVVGGQAGTRDRQVRTREQHFEVHCWGADVAQTENLVDAVVAAAWDLERGHQAAGSFVWETQTQDGADYAVLGEKVTLEMVAKVPVRTAASQLTQIAAQDHTGNFVADDTGSTTTVC